MILGHIFTYITFECKMIKIYRQLKVDKIEERGMI